MSTRQKPHSVIRIEPKFTESNIVAPRAAPARRHLTAVQRIALCGGLLLLTLCASAERIHGHVGQIATNRFAIRTRAFPVAWLEVNDKTAFLCHDQQLPFGSLHTGDPVRVQFHVMNQQWIATRINIQIKQTYCSARSANDSLPGNVPVR